MANSFIYIYKKKLPNNPGSKHFSDKHFVSIVLLAVVDANGKFVVVDVGSCGGNSGGGVFARFQLGRRLLSDKYIYSRTSLVPGTNFELPYVFVADDAFPPRENLTKRFPPQIKKKLTDTQTRLSRCPEYFRNFLVPPKLFWSKKLKAVFIICCKQWCSFGILSKKKLPKN